MGGGGGGGGEGGRGNPVYEILASITKGTLADRDKGNISWWVSHILWLKEK